MSCVCDCKCGGFNMISNLHVKSDDIADRTTLIRSFVRLVLDAIAFEGSG